MQYLDERWFESAFAALLETLNYSSDTRRKAIQYLYDEGFWDSSKLTWEAAEKRFRDGCNRNKTDVNWKLAEIWALMKRFGRHDFFLAMAEDLGYEVRRKPTQERVHDLVERALDLLAKNEATADALRGDLQRLLNGETVPAATVSHLPRPSFSVGERGF